MIRNTKSLFDEMSLFEPGEGGYPVFRIPGIVSTKSGVLVAYAEARSTPSDWASIDLVLKRSKDGGKTWGALQVNVANPSEESATWNNPVMIAEQASETVHFLYCKNYHEVFYRKSANAGLDWSEPVDITPTFDAFRAEGRSPKLYPWKVVAVGPGHGIELSNGRLLTAVWLANGVTDRAHGPSVIATAYSDDKGGSWHAGDIIEATPEVVSPNETTAVELDDGSVLLNIRHQSSRRAVAVSKDGARGWSVPELQGTLIDPRCFGSLARYSFSTDEVPGRILFVNAKDPEYRRNITLKMSEDGGRTWTYEKAIQPGQGAYSDVAVACDKTIHVLYEQGYGIRAVRTNVEWLTDGCELENLLVDSGKLQPAFRSDIRNYVLDIREEVAEIEVTPLLPIYSEAVVQIGGRTVSSGMGCKVKLNGSGDTVIKQLVSSPQAARGAEYGITVRRSLAAGTLVGHWGLQRVGPDGILPDVVGMNRGAKIELGRLNQGLAFGLGDFTASLWVKPEQWSEKMSFLWYGDVGEGARGWFLRAQSYSRIFFRTGGDGFQNLAATDADSLVLGQWTHVAVTRQGHEMIIIVNGRAATRKWTNVVHNVNGQDLYSIGKSNVGGNSSWAGLIDDVRLYNYALSMEEIRQIYEQTTR
jgi:sialidase-1